MRCGRIGDIGATDARVVSEARRLGLTQVRWTADTLDWRRPGVAALVARFQQYTRPGAIILAHDVHLDTVRAVERMLPRWRAERLAPQLRHQKPDDGDDDKQFDERETDPPGHASIFPRNTQ